jgi:predicted choloylglycine hydrolase
MLTDFPTLDFNGNHTQLGYFLGQKFKFDIRKELKTYQLIAGRQYGQFLSRLHPYHLAAEKWLPELIDEVKGLAQGAGVDYWEALLLNVREVNDLIDPMYNTSGTDKDHCTIAVSFSGQGPIIGHNEDANSELISDLYILKANVNGHKFICLNYSGVLPGACAGMTETGLVQCVNEINQKPELGIPKIFLARAILDMDTILEAEAFLQEVPRASGFNHVLVQNNLICNVEIAAGRLAIQKYQNTPFVHTNHYTNPELQMYETFHTQSSESRYRQAKRLVSLNMSLKQMKALLGDHSDRNYPICRHLNKSNEITTIASLILCPLQQQIYVNPGVPCQDNFSLVQ